MSLTDACLNCGGKVEGSVDDVPLSICCEECVTKTKNSSRDRRIYGCDYCISKTRALAQYKSSVLKQLTLLHFVTKSSRRAKKGPPMKLFLEEEVATLKKLSISQRRALRTQQRSAVLEKKKELEGDFGLNLSAMDVNVRHFLLGNFLNLGGNSHPKTTSEEVRSRCAVVSRVQEIMKANERPHPEDVFLFFLNHPDAAAPDFWEFRNNVRKAFQLEGARILHCLPKTNQKKLEKTILKDVYEDFSKRDVAGLIHGHLLKGTDRKTADEIVRCPACQGRMERGGEEEAVARKLLQFWNEKDDRAKRMKRLTTGLAKRNVVLPTDFEIAEPYLSGEMDCDEDEIAGAFELHGRHAHGTLSMRFFGLLSLAGSSLGLMQRRLYEEKLDYAEAVKAVLEGRRDGTDSEATTFTYSDYSDGYHEERSVDSWARRYWSDDSEPDYYRSD